MRKGLQRNRFLKLHAFRMGVNWSAGLEGLDRRFMPYNGIVAQDQLAWLDKYEEINWTHAMNECFFMLAHCHSMWVCYLITTKMIRNKSWPWVQQDSGGGRVLRGARDRPLPHSLLSWGLWSCLSSVELWAGAWESHLEMYSEKINKVLKNILGKIFWRNY